MIKLSSSQGFNAILRKRTFPEALQSPWISLRELYKVSRLGGNFLDNIGYKVKVLWESF